MAGCRSGGRGSRIVTNSGAARSATAPPPSPPAPARPPAPAPPLDADLQAANDELKSAIQNAVPIEEHSSDYPGARGLTVENGTGDPVGKGYQDIQLAKDTHWPDALARLASAPPPLAPKPKPKA